MTEAHSPAYLDNIFIYFRFKTEQAQEKSMFDWLADRKASKGAAQMDQKSPNWPSEINKKKLDIRHCNECIIAQSQKTLYLRGFSALFGMEGWSRQGRRFAKQHGFFVSRFAQLFGFHKTLRSAWVRQIDKRLAAQPVAD